MKTHLVHFHGETITTFETEDGIYVPVKPLCERFGVSLTGQLAKFRKHPQRWGVKQCFIPSTSGEQQTSCLPLTKVAGWLGGIEVHRIKTQFRDALTAYQNEADEVLDRYFRGQHQVLEARVLELTAELKTSEKMRRRAANMAIGHHGLMARIAAYQQAGVERLKVPSMLRRKYETIMDIIEEMEDCGLIDYGDWAEWDEKSKSYLAKRDLYQHAHKQPDLFAEG